MDKSTTYIGLDVHKDTIAVALAEAGVRGDVREYGKIANTPATVQALATKLSRVGNALRFCYEAGPCGYGIQRQLTWLGHGCVVVAPSLIPRKSGIGSRPTGGMRSISPSCIAPVNRLDNAINCCFSMENFSRQLSNHDCHRRHEAGEYLPGAQNSYRQPLRNLRASAQSCR